MFAKIPAIIILCTVFAFSARRLLAYLRYFQQEEYNDKRFVPWLTLQRAWDTRGTVWIAVPSFAAALLGHGGVAFLLALVAAVGLSLTAFYFEEDPRKSGKLRLNMTQRARKIYITALILLASASLCFTFVLLTLSWSSAGLLALTACWSLALVQSPPWLLMAANRVLSPLERRVQQHFYDDARRILGEVNPFIIGITGSYGKTGAKAALGDLLQQCVGATFWPKKSINTVMGITRTIREELKSYHQFGVIEMGAYNVGSINRLCEFTPPRAALVTAVGIMHLERFGSQENIYRAKSELAQAVPPDGILVCNGDNPGARRMAKQYDKSLTLLYGTDLSSGHLDCYASEITFDDHGSSFSIHLHGHTYKARTPLLGRPAISNILGAFTLACALGADPAYATACLASMQPVDNRLVLDKSAGVSFLRDAYNSNPTGFAAALEVLGTINAERRILLTPGMIELGDLQYDENKRLASMAAGICDLIVVIGRTNRDALLSGLESVAFDKDKMRVVDSREEAFEFLKGEQRAGDLVLIENDLPDLHESSVRF